MQILISEEEIRAPIKRTDLLVALNQDTINKHAQEVADEGGIIFDGEKKLDTGICKPTTNQFPIPLARLANEAGNKELLSNTVAIGAVLALTKGDLAKLTELIREEFRNKGDEVVQMNIKAAESGYNYARETFPDKIQERLQPKELTEKTIIVNGNEAAAMGAIAGGVQFAAIYPMSPVSNILHVLAEYQEKFGYIYKQPEDEISAINMAIGAGFAGARALTTTSGGGFCLMTEAYGLAAMTETPLVIIEGMRPGPATGLPTWSGQGDLQFILHAHQGDFPRIVLAAGDTKEAFWLTAQAFNLAEKYQTPVVVIIDKNICEDDSSVPEFDLSGYNTDRGKITKEFDADFSRYAPTDDGISIRSIPGKGNFFIGSSYEHDEKGLDTEEAQVTNQQQEKRMRKLLTCQKEDMPGPELFGPQDADITLVSWGSNKGSILEAIRERPNVNFLHLTWMSPFPTEAVKAVLTRAKYLIDVECNYSAQLAQLIAEKTGIDIADKLLKYDGRPFWPEEITEKINQVMKI